MGGFLSFLKGLIPSGSGGDETLPGSVQEEGEEAFEKELDQNAREDPDVRE